MNAPSSWLYWLCGLFWPAPAPPGPRRWHLGGGWCVETFLTGAGGPGSRLLCPSGKLGWAFCRRSGPRHEQAAADYLARN